MWELVKAIIVIFGFFICIGVISINLGFILYKTFTRNRSEIGLAFVNSIMFILGAVLFALLGMFFASLTEVIGTNAPNKYTIGIMAFWMLSFTYSAFKTYHQTKAKGNGVQYSDTTFLRDYKFWGHRTTLIIYRQLFFIPLSFVFFIIYRESADKFTLGLYSFLKNFVSN